MRSFLLVSMLLPGLLLAQSNPDYDPDFDDNGCYTVMDILSLLVLLMPENEGMEPMNPNYDPDSDGDGTVSIGDLTHLLTLFGTCDEVLLCSVASMNGYTYNAVEIGGQCWFAENLRTEVYADGTAIPEVADSSGWAALSTGARCDYNNDSANVAISGRRYNWFAVDNSRGLCPSGWHVPTDEDWTVLEQEVASQGFGDAVGTALKSTEGWDGSGNGTDDFGFAAYPGGFRDYTGAFDNVGFSGDYWTSSSLIEEFVWYRIFVASIVTVERAGINKEFGLMVRCLRDSDFTEVQGCTDPDYQEYNPLANIDDGSCASLPLDCVGPSMDGYTYSVVEIDGQCWFAENLRTTSYRNGEALASDLTEAEWSNAAGATATYGEGTVACVDDAPDLDACDSAMSLDAVGRLYNWHAVNDDRGLCPTGWHVPAQDEWMALEDFLSTQVPVGTEGNAIKSTTGWYNGGNGTDSYGFSGMPGGNRTANGDFDFAGRYSYWWSSTSDVGGASFWFLYFINSDIRSNSVDAGYGFSVRCLQNED